MLAVPKPQDQGQLPDKSWTRFTSLPTEIRTLILRFAIGRPTYNITNECLHLAVHPTEKLVEQSKFLLDAAAVGSSSRWRFARGFCPHGLLTTCRQLTKETMPILYEQAAFCFDTPATLCSFFGTRLDVLALVHSVQLACGPGKYVGGSQKVTISAAIKLLVDQAPKLKHLCLDFQGYYSIEHDVIVLSSFWLNRICRFRGLSSLSISVSLDFPGPIGNLWVGDSLKVKVQGKVHRLEEVLAQSVCSSRTPRDSIASKVSAVKHAMRETSIMVEAQRAAVNY